MDEEQVNNYWNGSTWRTKSTTEPRDKSKRQEITEEQTHEILFCLFIACDGTMNHYLQPTVSRKHQQIVVFTSDHNTEISKP